MGSHDYRWRLPDCVEGRVEHMRLDDHGTSTQFDHVLLGRIGCICQSLLLRWSGPISIEYAI